MNEEKAIWLENILRGFVKLIPTKRPVRVFPGVRKLQDQDVPGIALHVRANDVEALIEAFSGTSVRLTHMEATTETAYQVYMADVPDKD